MSPEHLLGGMGVQGHAEVVALGGAAAQGAQALGLFLALDPFGDGHQTQGLGDLDDGLGQAGRVVIGQRGDERAVDLEDVDRELLEVGQRRIPGAEVVDGDAEPECAQARAGSAPPSRCRASWRSR